MDKASSKSRQVLKMLGIVLLMGISINSWFKGGAHLLKFKALLSSDWNSSDTIIIGQERSIIQVFVGIVKRLPFIDWQLPNHNFDVQLINSFAMKGLFINGYQRNVFYVYASFSVP